MKDKIIEILNSFRVNVSNDSNVSDYAIQEGDFNELADELVKKLSKPTPAEGECDCLTPQDQCNGTGLCVYCKKPITLF